MQPPGRKREEGQAISGNMSASPADPAGLATTQYLTGCRRDFIAVLAAP